MEQALKEGCRRQPAGDSGDARTQQEVTGVREENEDINYDYSLFQDAVNSSGNLFSFKSASPERHTISLE